MLRFAPAQLVSCFLVCLFVTIGSTFCFTLLPALHEDGGCTLVLVDILTGMLCSEYGFQPLPLYGLKIDSCFNLLNTPDGICGLFGLWSSPIAEWLERTTL